MSVSLPLPLRRGQQSIEHTLVILIRVFGPPEPVAPLAQEIYGTPRGVEVHQPGVEGGGGAGVRLQPRGEAVGGDGEVGGGWG
eukprot:CAMPEP_0114292874 /NCGR_PEP_ID=MMETSP0059-20121206/9297_1 /TAXON_ID=36894 /ORGANISM="Pyramimonas parkeae, Strain CCMP726" /LENGTH=82 /DNA_ID=CAMNT_0001414557 /DNA_START=1137 /DNA_END=1381 /DNA_ORIENTATION=-